MTIAVEIQVIFVTLVAGVLGGSVNALREPIDPDSPFAIAKIGKTALRKTRWWLNIGMSVMAAFIVPVFLWLIQSKILDDMFDPKDPAFQTSLFVFFGLCLVAAYSAQTFIDTITKRVLQAAEEAKAEASAAQERVNQLEEDITESDDDVDDAEAASSVLAISAPDMNPEQMEILQLLAEKPEIRRSVGRMRSAVKQSMDRDKVETISNALVEMGLAKKYASRKDNKARFKISDSGITAMQTLSPAG